MVTKWEYSLKSEAERLIHDAHYLVTGFYKTNNFIVLPCTSSSFNYPSNVVTFPDIEINSIPRFWEAVKKVDASDLPLKISPDLTEKVVNLLSNTNWGLIPNSFKGTKSLWAKAENEVLREIYKILPEKKGLIKKIIIHPTSFGTVCSFNRIKREGIVYLYLRQDQGIHTICEAILTSLTRNDIYDRLDGLWQESEIITDFLITQTSLSKILEKFENPRKYLATVKGIRIKQQVKMLQQSEEFYKKLGIPTFDKPFGYNGLIPELFGKPIENLTVNERRVMLNLIKNSNTVTNIDEIGNLMFNSDSQFSLYAIAKLIQRLRTKLELNGISGSYIQTLRGKGYLLRN